MPRQGPTREAPRPSAENSAGIGVLGVAHSANGEDSPDLCRVDGRLASMRGGQRGRTGRPDCEGAVLAAMVGIRQDSVDHSPWSLNMASVLSGGNAGVPDAARDPVKVVADVVANPDLSDDDKIEIISLANKRFRHRRRMAYIALGAIIASLIAVFIAAFIDGAGENSKILESLAEAGALLAWIEAFLASIVAAYFGVSAWRPAS